MSFSTDNNTTPTKVVFKLFWVVGWVVAIKKYGDLISEKHYF